MSIEYTIKAAAADMADSLSGGKSNPRRRAAMSNFLEAALWAAASVAEDLPQSAWINPKADDSWFKTADADRFPLPETMTPEQFKGIAELLGTDKDALEKMIGTRIKLQPELKAAVEGIVGHGHSRPAIMPSEHKTAPATEHKTAPALAPVPEHRASDGKESAPKPKPEEVQDVDSPPKRKDPMKHDNIEPRVDEFEGDISKNPHLPGAPDAQ